MRKTDLFFMLGLAAAACPFIASERMVEGYNTLNSEHGIAMSFAKFAVLATLGEVIAVRIRTGRYNPPGFGILPRALVWGLLGITVKLAMGIFAMGTPAVLASFGVPLGPEVMKGALSSSKMLGALSISVAMNLVYAPVLMTIHKVTDEHIARTGGTLRGLLRPIDVAGILSTLNWRVHWDFVFKKTIPLFWIPAHTITFLLPGRHQVLFAALLGVALGVLLAMAKPRTVARSVEEVGATARTLRVLPP